MRMEGLDLPPSDISMQHYATPSREAAHRRLSHGPLTGHRSLDSGDVARRRASHNDTTFSSAVLENMPSRQRSQQRSASRKQRSSHKRSAEVATIRLRHGENLDATDLAERFVRDPLYTDQPDGLQSRELKEIPRNIGYKMAVRQQIKESRTLGRNVRRPGWFKMLGYSISLAWKRFNDNRAEIGYSLDLWRSSIKKIEGNFGTGVASYFLFIKWLFLLNVFTSLILIIFIVMPRMLQRWLGTPRGYDSQNVTFSGVELLTGGGWFTYTEMYYGDYTGVIIDIIDGLSYDMRFAYVCTIGAFYLVTVLSLAYSLSKSYKENCINVSGGVHFYYALKVLASWDYTVDEPKAAALKQKGIVTELQEYLAEIRNVDVQHSCGGWCMILLLRCGINVTVLLLLAGSGYLVWFISISQSLQNDVVFLREMALPVCFTAINFILPFAFSILTTLEKYHNPRVALYLTMLRTIILNVVTLGVLVYFWFESVDCYKQGIDTSVLQGSTADCSMCWENFMGQQLYRLVILDFIFILISTFLSEFLRRVMSQFCFKSLTRPEFNIGRNTLNLIYSQVLVWLGVFYSPMLSFVMVLKLLVVLYVKRVSVLQNCVPSVRSWRGGRTHTAILGFLFAAFILCFVAVSYSVALLRPSQDCGAYTGYNTSYAVLSEGLQDWRRENKDLLSNILVDIFTSTASIIAVFVLLCVVAYYTRRAAQRQKQMVALLLNQIALEGKEKLFLLRISEKIHAGTSVDPRYVPKDKVIHVPRQPATMTRPSESGDVEAAVSPRSNQPLGGHPSRTQTSTPVGVPYPVCDPKDQSPQRHRKPKKGQRHTPSSTATDRGAYSVQTLTGRDSPRTRNEVTPEVYNKGYVSHSLEHDDTVELGHHEGATPYMWQAENRAYRDHSPNSKPSLPYPAQMYVRKVD